MPNGAMVEKIIDLMRDDTTGTYKLLMLVLAPGLVTKNKIANGMVNGTNWSEIVTVSDEAFLMMALLNYWNTWVQDNLKLTRTDFHQDKTQWSTAGRGKTWCKYNGWDTGAITVMVSCQKAVVANRANRERNDKFDEDMRALIIPTLSKDVQNQIAKKSKNKHTVDNDATAEEEEYNDYDELMNAIV
jgi:hypothetical protein